jgi:transcriptional regulator with XRE-family HTH domain
MRQLSALPVFRFVDGPRALAPSALPAAPFFGAALRELRLRLDIKQVSLSTAMGCSDAAISLWEAGTRLPRPRFLDGLLRELAGAGAPAAELGALRDLWNQERMLRLLMVAAHAPSRREYHSARAVLRFERPSRELTGVTRVDES